MGRNNWMPGSIIGSLKNGQGLWYKEVWRVNFQKISIASPSNYFKQI